jgi:hypothetical protein
MPPVAFFNPLVTRRTCQSICEFSPKTEATKAGFERKAVRGIPVFGVKGCYADFALRQKRRIHEVRHILHALHAMNRVDERYEAVGLAATKLGVKADDGGNLNLAA